MRDNKPLFYLLSRFLLNFSGLDGGFAPRNLNRCTFTKSS
jgi:hypothetical protein